MEILLSYLLSPAVFFGVLGVIFIVSCWVLSSLARQTSLQLKEKDAVISRIRLPLKEMEDKSAEQEAAYKARILQLERALKASEEKQITAGEQGTRSKSDNAALRKTIEELQGRALDKEDVVRQLNVARNENDMLKRALEKMKSAPPAVVLVPMPGVAASSAAPAAPKSAVPPAPQVDPQLLSRVNVLQEQSAKLTKELTLKNQLYDGLKAQYGELEKSLEGIMQQLEKEKKAQQLLSQRLWEISKPQE